MIDGIAKQTSQTAQVLSAPELKRDPSDAILALEFIISTFFSLLPLSHLGEISLPNPAMQYTNNTNTNPMFVPFLILLDNLAIASACQHHHLAQCTVN